MPKGSIVLFQSLSIFAVGLGISAVSAYFFGQVFAEQTMNFIRNFPLGFTGLWILQIILVLVLGAKAQKNPSLTIAGYLVLLPF